MRRKRDFALAIRRGRRTARRTVVVHLLVPPDGRNVPLVGFVVSRAVGGAVVRNRVRRRLRHICRARISRLPQGSLLVVRANPSAAEAVHEQLVNDLDDALDRLSGRAEHRPGAR